MQRKLAALLVCALLAASSAHAVDDDDAPTLDAIEKAGRQLASPLSKEQARGQAWLKANDDAAFAEIIRILGEGELKATQRVAKAAVMFISPWARAVERGNTHKGQIELFVPARPTGRPVDHPRAAALRKAALAALETMLTNRPRPAADDTNGKNPSFPGWEDDYKVRALCSLLAETADKDAADHVAALLAREDNRYLAAHLMRMLDTYHGRPLTFSQGGMCGNSTPEEFRQFDISENKRCTAAKEELLAWHKRIAGLPQEQRIAAALDRWDAALKSNDSAFYMTDSGDWAGENPWYSMVFRLGEAAVPQIKQRLATMRGEELSPRRALYEIALATITGKIDQDEVRGLLQGQTFHKYLACELIVAAGSKDFKNELAALVGGNDAPMKASYALACVLRMEAIPILQTAPGGNFIADCAIKELKAWGE